MSNNRFMSSSNPFVSEKQFSNSNVGISKEAGVMTVQGAVNKTIILTGILFASALFALTSITPSMGMLYGTMFGALAIAFVTFFKPTAAPISAPLYAVVEGLLVGMVCNLYSGLFGPGIIFNALMLTILCLASMLFAYKTGMIQATEKFRSIITTATGAIFMIYMLSMFLNLVFGMHVPYLHEGGMIGIGISLFIIAIASLNLILDFDNIEQGAKHGAPAYMEWASALGLLITLVWIFFEILRLLSVLASSND